MNRRTLLAALPAVAGIAPAVATGAAGETPVSVAYREWKAFYDWIENEIAGMPDDEFREYCDRRGIMESAMIAMPSANVRNAALKLLAFTGCGDCLADDGYGTLERLLKEVEAMAYDDVGRS